METVTFQGTSIKRCLHCSGMWFDLLDHQHLAAKKGSEVIDNGSRSVGRQYNQVDQVWCPQCDQKMLRMVDAQQSHIWYESCPSCHGVFLDAGEFVDYKKHKLWDEFRDLLTPAR